MRVTYSGKADAVYIYLVDQIGAGEVAKTYPCDPIEVDGEINLDFDDDGRLIGIEILDASKKLPQSVLESAEQLS